MTKLFSTLLLGILVFSCALAASSQVTDGNIKASLVPGDVISVSDSKIVIKTKDGELIVELSPKTEYKRIAAEKPSIASATASALSEIVAGDKVIVSGVFGTDRSKLPARTVYLMSKSDIAQKNAKDAERWTVKGISGKVNSVNLATKQVGIEVRGLMGATTTTMITAKDNAIFKRYAPNSVKYNEAVASTLLDIQPGDMLRATGEKSGDGLSFSAEEIITGAFQTIAGTVKSIDPEKNEIVITNLHTNKDMTVSLATATTLKKFPAEFAQRMAQFQGGGTPGAGGQRPGGQPGAQPGAQPGGQPGAQSNPSGQPGANGQPGGPGRGMMGGRGGIDEMLERFPNITAVDLKVGDMVAVSSTKNGAVDKISAIKLLAGVEPFIRAAQASGEFQRAARAGQGGFSIPGLDGFDSP